jgi:A/G-specific adenine glycosylase
MFGTDSIILKKRQAGDIWQGLYDFPLIERKDPELLQIIDMLDFASSFYEDLDPNSFSVRKVLEKKHILTHQNLYVSVYKIDLPFGDTELFYPYIIVPVDLLDRYAFPVVFQDLIDSN